MTSTEFHDPGVGVLVLGCCQIGIAVRMFYFLNLIIKFLCIDVAILVIIWKCICFNLFLYSSEIADVIVRNISSTTFVKLFPSVWLVMRWNRERMGGGAKLFRMNISQCCKYFKNLGLKDYKVIEQNSNVCECCCRRHWLEPEVMLGGGGVYG